MSEKILSDDKQVGLKAGYHHGDLRAQLLNAVRHLVEEKGAENFSIAEAARLAGVSSAAPYRHFKDKPAILKAVVLVTMDGMAQEMKRVVEPHPVGSLERIVALGQSYIDFARDHTGMFRLVFGISESHEGDEELAAMGRSVFINVIQAVADYLGVTADHPLAQQRAYMLWTMVHGHSWLMIDGKAKSQGIDFPEHDLLTAIAQSVVASIKSDAKD